MKWSCLQLELEGTNRYTRTLAYFWMPELVEGWILFTEELVAQGYAIYKGYSLFHNTRCLVAMEKRHKGEKVYCDE